MFKVGDVVRHEEYGQGFIKYVVAEDEDTAPYFVQFDNTHDDLHGGGWRGFYGREGCCHWLRDSVLCKVVTFRGNKHATAN